MNTTTLRRPFVVLAALGGACALIISTLSVAGPLDPPAGAVASSYKTLSEVEPRTAINAVNTPGDINSQFRITRAGSYYLTGSITGVVGKHGIKIAASGVTIDLNGFDLVGVANQGDFCGVASVGAAYTNTTVRNGSVRNWGGRGVHLSNYGQTNCTIADVTASGNGDGGVSVSICGTITNCTAYGNTGIGIISGSGSVITGCMAYDNTSDGIYAGTNGNLSHCAVTGNGGDGIHVSSGGVVSECSAYGNLGVGFDMGPSMLISRCNAAFNDSDGIFCLNDSIILDNICDDNGQSGTGAGIHTSSSDTRVEGNNCSDNVIGIQIASGGCVIIRNTCSGNTTNWTIAANNTYGPIIDRVGVATPAVSGNSATEAIGSTHPNANFSY